MRIGYIFFAMMWLILGLAIPVNTQESVIQPDILIVGAPCACFRGLTADICDAELELDQLLAGREYCVVVLTLGDDASVEEYQYLISKILRTQPQARTLICASDPEVHQLADANRMECAQCCEILTMIGDR